MPVLQPYSDLLPFSEEPGALMASLASHEPVSADHAGVPRMRSCIWHHVHGPVLRPECSTKFRSCIVPGTLALCLALLAVHACAGLRTLDNWELRHASSLTTINLCM